MDSTTPTYFDALRAICQPIRAGDYPGSLEPMRHLLGALDNPQERFPSVVVAGSVGKGTTCHHIARFLRAGGLKVGLYTSPHLHSFRERFVIDEQMISREDFVGGVQAVMEASRRLGAAEMPAYSTFELATALALWWFAQNGVDTAVLEVGLGGRWDAVNAVSNALAVFTPIETEHIAMLGGSRQTIAWQKAGIIQRDGYAVTGRQQGEILTILQHEADHKRARLNTVDTGADAGLEETAACLALGAYRNLVERGIVRRRSWGLISAFNGLPGRLERQRIDGHNILIDGGHTPLAALCLREAINGLLKPSQKARLVLGMLQDKEVRDFLATFDKPRFHLVLTRAPGHRASAPEKLLTLYRPTHAAVEVAPDLNDALSQVYSAPESLFVVAGSLRMVAAAREAYGLLTDDDLEEARATRAIFEGDDYLAKLRPRRL